MPAAISSRPASTAAVTAPTASSQAQALAALPPYRHEVAKGETLYRLAIRWNTTPQTLAGWNNLPNADQIFTGQKLEVPGFRAYTVKAGDTLYAIARRLGTTVPSLAGLNGLADPSKIQVGQVLAVQVPEGRRPGATSASVRGSDFNGGTVTAVIDGKTRHIATGAVKAWTLDGGRYVAWSGRDGSGGYENEGMSLRVFDTQTGRVSRVLSEYNMVDDVRSVRLSNGRTVLLVAMSDGGLGADHLAIVDPSRGQVLKRTMAKVMSVKGDTVTIGHFQPEDYAHDGVSRLPQRSEALDLKKVVDGKLVVNKRLY